MNCLYISLRHAVSRVLHLFSGRWNTIDAHGKLGEESMTGVTPVTIDVTGVTIGIQVGGVSPVPILSSQCCQHGNVLSYNDGNIVVSRNKLSSHQLTYRRATL